MRDQSADLRATIGKVMGEVLVRAPLTAHDDFFECGGDSLRAVEVLQRLVEEHGPAGTEAADDLQAELLLAIFDDASPAGLASVIAAHAN
ncbi:acyl carrier protein [Amycolatopsis anabasis]|uniref:acyl carrier protein n=1 Tax=Amycolatopsis anabasis TaxID=1840409 RepID=UPI00131EBFB2|nr:acyl carrier protein [Amycolatopsis anabasis]